MSTIVLCINFILSLACTFALVIISRHSNVHQVLLSVVLTFSNLGFFMLSTTSNIESALFANTVSYAGGVFIPMILMFMLASFSKIKIPKWFIYFISFINVVIYVLIATTEFTGFYYQDFELKYGVSAYISAKYGILYPVRLVILAVELILCLVFFFRSGKSKKAVSTKAMFPYIVVLFLGVLGYGMEYILNLKSFILPFVYLVAAAMLVVVSENLGFYDVSLSVGEKIQELSNYAYIVFDKDLRFIGCNKPALDFFPELANVKIDSPYSPSTYASGVLFNWLIENAKKGEQQYGCKYERDLTMNDGIAELRKFLHVEMSFLHSNFRKSIIGYLVEITDNTTQHDVIEKLNFSGMRYKREADNAIAKAKNMQTSIILGMAAMIESRDNSTGGHINRTSACMALFVDNLRKNPGYSYPEYYWDSIINAAPLHDLGKIMVDDRILKKPESLNDEEYAEMKTHAAEGAKLLRSVLADVDDREYVKVATNIAHYHHEKYDGSGYPDHLTGEEIPFEARIMALPDVFDALASARYYKAHMTYDEAFDIIKKDLGTHFDPRLGRIFLSMRKEISELYDSFETTSYSRRDMKK